MTSHISHSDSGSQLNWARHYRDEGRVVQPQSVDSLRELVATSGKLGFRGSRHSFNAIADSALLIDMRRLPRSTHVDPDRRIATVSGETTYGTLSRELERCGLALANLASLPHITRLGRGRGRNRGNPVDRRSHPVGTSRFRGEIDRGGRFMGEPVLRGDSVGFHFTWRSEPQLVNSALRLIEDALIAAWRHAALGKMFLADSSDLQDRYPKLDDFVAQRLDPNHAYRNAWLDRNVFP